MHNKKVTSALEDISIMKDFFEVFLKEVSRLLPQCDVKFIIELEATLYEWLQVH